MCLEISTIHHPDLKPLTAEKDIEVVKFLKPELHEFSMPKYDTCEIMAMTEFSLRTPYMSYPVEFDENDECVMEHYMSTFDGLWVVEGIHAYTEIMWWYQRQKDLLLTCTPFKAYIPKGTKYYFGTNGDIVAEKIIIKNTKY